MIRIVLLLQNQILVRFQKQQTFHFLNSIIYFRLKEVNLYIINFVFCKFLFYLFE